jgi:hypothetical protein
VTRFLSPGALLILENLNENDYEVIRLNENRRRMLNMVEEKKRNEERLAEWTEAIERHLQSTEMGGPGEIEKYLASRLVTEQES